MYHPQPAATRPFQTSVQTWRRRRNFLLLLVIAPSPTAHPRLLSAPFVATPALSWALPAPPARVCIWSCRKPRATLPASSVTGSGSRAGGRAGGGSAGPAGRGRASDRSRLCITEAGTWAPQQVRLERAGNLGKLGGGRWACLGSGRAGARKLRAPGRVGDGQDAGKKGDAGSGI